MINTNDGLTGSWGDTRNIDDWTHHQIEETLEIPLPGRPKLDIEKTSDAVNPRIGDTVTYTVEVKNEGPGDYTAANPGRIQDDLSGVLDDATYNGDVSASSGTATINGDRLTWEGPLAKDETVTITYSVTLTGEGDLNVDNVAFQVVCEDDDPDCTPPPPTECVDNVNPETGLPCDDEEFDLPFLKVDKQADKSQLPRVGETVTYTITAENSGEADYTAARPAVVLDDLADVLDDATIDTSTLTADRGPTPTLSGSALSWVGELAVGEIVTITFDVTYTGEGDGRLTNVAWGPQCDADDPECTTPQPKCDPRDENGRDPVTGEPCGRVEIPGSLLKVTKDVDPEKGTTVEAGEELTYTITFSNIDGEAEAAVDSWADDLSRVLDDADLIVNPTPSNSNLVVSSVAGGRFTVDGVVPAGESYTVTYTVRVRPDGDRGDNLLANFVLPPGPVDPDPKCEPDDPLCTENPVPEMSERKAVDPASGTKVQPGQEMTYTLTFTNNGKGKGKVNRVDDLTHLLDDAQIISGPTPSDGSLSVSPVSGGRFTITGKVDAGKTVTVTYTVRVNESGALGDGVIANFLLDPVDPPPVDPVCEPKPDEDPNCTTNPVSDISIVKSSDPKSGTKLEAGQKVTYTLTFTNTGAVEGAVDHTDHMAGVLDDAKVVTEPTPSDPALSVTRNGDSYTVTGNLAPDQTVVVTYTVEVLDWDEQGDHQLGNFITVTGEEPPAECGEGSPWCTEHPTKEPFSPGGLLPKTGADVAAFAGIAALLLLVAGGTLFAANRRKVTAGAGQEVSAPDERV